MSDWRNVQLPEALCAAAEQKYAATFASVEDLLTFLLKESLVDPTAQLDKDEQKMVEQRLRDLGYV